MKMNSLLLHDEFSSAKLLILHPTQHPNTAELIDIVHNFEQEHPYFESFTLFILPTTQIGNHSFTIDFYLRLVTTAI